MPAGENIFDRIPADLSAELIETIVAGRGCRIERIISGGQASPPDFWYDQPEDEWVIVLKGGAGLLFEGEDGARVLQKGDYVTIPAHCRHRVMWADPHGDTVWLAVHFASS
jgi:cupin 2 domain-containing protein